jgi:hypothetical protein
MPEGAVYVGRPTKWGNPFTVPDCGTHADAVRCFESLLRNGPLWNDEVRAELRGKDLVCWCSLDKPCHADVLLEIANAGTD